MIIEFSLPERPKRGRASLDVLQGLAGIYLDGRGLETAQRGLTSGNDANISTACTSIGEGVVRSYHDNKIDRGQAITEYLRLGLDEKTIPLPVVPSLGFQYRGH